MDTVRKGFANINLYFIVSENVTFDNGYIAQTFPRSFGHLVIESIPLETDNSVMVFSKPNLVSGVHRLRIIDGLGLIRLFC